MENRRNFVRVEGLQTIHFRVKSGAGEYQQVSVRNISLAGVSILCGKKLEVGEMVEFRFESAGNEQPMDAEGNVAWQMPEANNKGVFVTGIRFQNTDAKIREHISRFVIACARQVEEKREFVRCALGIQIIYRIVSVPGGASETPARDRVGHSVDISRGGMKMSVNEQLLLGTRMMITFSLPRDRASIHCESEVAWVRPGEAGIYQIGVRFRDISQRDADRVWAFVTRNCASSEQKEEI